MIVFPCSSDTQNKVNLSIKPLVCTVEQKGDYCDITVKVKWSSVKPINSCLFQGDLKTTCWQAKTQAKKDFEISINEDMEFTLMNKDKGVYAKQLVRVNTSQPKRYRRRLRADWSVF